MTAMTLSPPAPSRLPDRLLDPPALLAGARRCLPIAVSVFAYGLVFGALAAQSGLSIADGT